MWRRRGGCCRCCPRRCRRRRRPCGSSGAPLLGSHCSSAIANVSCLFCYIAVGMHSSTCGVCGGAGAAIVGAMPGAGGCVAAVVHRCWGYFAVVLLVSCHAAVVHIHVLLHCKMHVLLQCSRHNTAVLAACEAVPGRLSLVFPARHSRLCCSISCVPPPLSHCSSATGLATLKLAHNAPHASCVAGAAFL